MLIEILLIGIVLVVCVFYKFSKIISQLKYIDTLTGLGKNLRVFFSKTNFEEASQPGL